MYTLVSRTKGTNLAMLKGIKQVLSYPSIIDYIHLMTYIISNLCLVVLINRKIVIEMQQC